MDKTTPLAIDLFCGLGGWTEGLLAEGYRVVGFDIERHVYGEHRYPAQLVLQDVLTIHGAQFKDAALIVASPPCQAYSYRAMPWKKAKALPPPDNSLFEACFRIQREAIESAGHHIPLVVENVRGAQKWVGRARWHFGSFYLWGDVPALMPMMRKAIKVSTMGAGWYPPDHPKHVPGLAFNGHAERAIKNTGGSWFNIGSPGQKEVGRNPVHELAGVKVASDSGRRTDIGKGARFTSRDCGVEREGNEKTSARVEIQGMALAGAVAGDEISVRETLNPTGRSADARTCGAMGLENEGVKHKDADGYERNHPAAFGWKSPRTSSGATNARKHASAMIAKIPLVLARHIGQMWWVRGSAGG